MRSEFGRSDRKNNRVGNRRRVGLAEVIEMMFPAGALTGDEGQDTFFCGDGIYEEGTSKHCFHNKNYPGYKRKG